MPFRAIFYMGRVAAAFLLLSMLAGAAGHEHSRAHHVPHILTTLPVDTARAACNGDPCKYTANGAQTMGDIARQFCGGTCNRSLSFYRHTPTDTCLMLTSGALSGNVQGDRHGSRRLPLHQSGVRPLCCLFRAPLHLRLSIVGSLAGHSIN
jgi:hypothetical protein